MELQNIQKISKKYNRHSDMLEKAIEIKEILAKCVPFSKTINDNLNAIIHELNHKIEQIKKDAQSLIKIEAKVMDEEEKAFDKWVEYEMLPEVKKDEELKTLLNTVVPKGTKGILYLCKLEDEELKVKSEIFFESSINALEAYANIPNPESQLALETISFTLKENLMKLHKNMKDKEWLKRLKASI